MSAHLRPALEHSPAHVPAALAARRVATQVKPEACDEVTIRVQFEAAPRSVHGSVPCDGGARADLG